MNASKLKRRLLGTSVGRALLRIREDWGLLRTMWFNPEQGGMAAQEAVARILLPRLCRPSMVFIDVGAHIGSVVADVQAADPSVRIVAVEAVPEKAAYLARRYPDVEVYGVALGEETSHVSFFVDVERPGYSSLARQGRSPQAVKEIAVSMRRLDDLVEASAPVDFIKMDVEGAELGVLRGASGLVERCRPVLMFESGPDAAAAMGYSVEALHDWLTSRRYEVVVPDRVAHEGPSLGRDGFVEGHFYPFRTLNYFAIPSERRTEVRERARHVLGVT